MLMTRQDILSLKNLSTVKDFVSVDRIPAAFKNDFQRFFFGKTLVKDNDTLFAYPHDIKMWVRFIFNKYKD
ncbi:hypothetical protein SAMN05443667_10816 [Flavobacterium gillisiae]|jgi:hypothetical protein|uniref:Uncharacterized protein n=4 Tax=Flavobacteriaceae TaxID=49546 RepID=A0A4V6PFI8_9FLAO|nr:hypothetical protein E0F91_06345 [Flavobacterium sandaracinum]SEA74164.1 hypothetical protein SAMN05443667_10816 [Flavobacterium gillisiae]SEQ68540.1 hypothetical protein SAMN05444355_103333 [Flavobacterium frigoris]